MHREYLESEDKTKEELIEIICSIGNYMVKSNDDSFKEFMKETSNYNSSIIFSTNVKIKNDIEKIVLK